MCVCMSVCLSVIYFCLCAFFFCLSLSPSPAVCLSNNYLLCNLSFSFCSSLSCISFRLWISLSLSCLSCSLSMRSCFSLSTFSSNVRRFTSCSTRALILQTHMCCLRQLSHNYFAPSYSHISCLHKTISDLQLLATSFALRHGIHLESAKFRDFFLHCSCQSSETSDLNIGTLMATLPGAKHLRVSDVTGRLGV